MFVHCAIYDGVIRYRIRTCIIKSRFSIIMGFKNSNENEFHGFGILVIWLWKSFGKVL